MNCIFCDIVAGKSPAYKVYEDDICLAFLDIFPMSEGHVLIIPKEHGALMGDHDEPTRTHVMRVCNRILQALRASDIPCDGAQLMINDGKAANQHVPHLHMHIIPRKKGDSLRMAFMLLCRMLLPPFGKKPRAKMEAVAAAIKAKL